MQTKITLLEQVLTGLTRDHYRRLPAPRPAHIDPLGGQLSAPR